MGCLTITLVALLVLLLPFMMVDVMSTALLRLGLSPQAAAMSVLGIFAGSLINIPVHRVERPEPQPLDLLAVLGINDWGPVRRRYQRYTVIAVNVGGGLIPTLLALVQVNRILNMGGWPVVAVAFVAAANIAMCYAVARPVGGIGILMPGFTSPLVAVSFTWLLLAPPEFDGIRASVAFVGGILGPLIGADLLHLKDITKVSAGMLSIGGAGTFDGIVLSGLLAVLLA